MVLILLRNATSIHSRLDARRWRLTCISMHLRLHPSFAYSTSLGRAETRASRLDTFFLDEYFFLPFSYISLSLFPSKDFPTTKTIPLSSPSSWKARERGRIETGDKKRQEARNDFDPLPFAFSGKQRVSLAISPSSRVPKTAEIRKRLPRPFLVDSNWLRRDEEINQMEFPSVPFSPRARNGKRGTKAGIVKRRLKVGEFLFLSLNLCLRSYREFVGTLVIYYASV